MHSIHLRHNERHYSQCAAGFLILNLALRLLRSTWKSLRDSELGQDLAEYCLIIALVCLVVAGILWRVGGGLDGIWGTANSTLATGNSTNGGGASASPGH